MGGGCLAGDPCVRRLVQVANKVALALGEASVLHAFCLNILLAQDLASGRTSNPREQERSCNAFYNLASEFRQCYLYRSLLVTQNSPDPSGEKATQDCE